MAAIVCRAPRCFMTGAVLDGRSGGGGGAAVTGTRRPTGGAGGRRDGGVRAGGGGGPAPGRPRVGVARSTGIASATRPRMARGGGAGGGALAPFMGGTSAFALPFPTAPRLRAIGAARVPCDPPTCQAPARSGEKASRAEPTDAGGNQPNQGEQPENHGYHDHHADDLLNRGVQRQERLDQVENQANDDQHDDQLNKG